MANDSLSSLQMWKPLLVQLQKATQAVGVALKVRYSDRTLHLLLEGASVSSRKEWVAQVEALLKNHSLKHRSVEDSTTQILIYGRVQGKRYPAWKARIALAVANSSVPPSAGNPQGSRDPYPWRRRPRWLAPPALRPAQKGFKDIMPPLVSEEISRQRLKSPSPELLEIKAVLGGLGSQQWIARSMLGLFGMAIVAYLYIGTWFIPSQARQWSELQPELDRIEAAKPRNLEEMETLLQELEKTIVRLQGFSPLSGIFYQRARAHIQILTDRQRHLEYRYGIEETGQTYLGQAKRLAAQANLMLETLETDSSPPTTPDHWRSIQQNWLIALYWLNQVPGQTFAIRERNQLLREYQTTYWQIQQDADNSFQFNGTL